MGPPIFGERFMTIYYAEYLLETGVGERYVLPIAIDAATIEDANISAQTLFQEKPATVKKSTLQWGPKQVDGQFQKHISDRVRNWQGHVQAGRLTTNQFVAVGLNHGSIEGLEILVGDDGFPVARLAATEHPLYRVLATPESRQEGEVFVLLVDSLVTGASFIPIGSPGQGKS
jgi:hypothetical protein